MMNYTTIGTDLSLAECRREGYLMMKYNQGDVFSDGCISLNSSVTFKRTSVNLHMTRKVKKIVAFFKEHRTEVLSLVGGYSNIEDEDNPTPHDVLEMADLIDMYYGLNEVNR